MVTNTYLWESFSLSLYLSLSLPCLLFLLLYLIVMLLTINRKYCMLTLTETASISSHECGKLYASPNIWLILVDDKRNWKWHTQFKIKNTFWISKTLLHLCFGIFCLDWFNGIYKRIYTYSISSFLFVDWTVLFINISNSLNIQFLKKYSIFYIIFDIILIWFS